MDYFRGLISVLLTRTSIAIKRRVATFLNIVSQVGKNSGEVGRKVALLVVR
ncbi:MAG TPA: hypothetical protein VKU38_20035 [Ktedonobacteraceae bacterium]|nr:hypothetical protein [Ktedonobacteraceae bacterium]